MVGDNGLMESYHLVYVNDIFVIGNNPRLITQLKDHLHRTFKTNNLGPIQWYLGVRFDRDSFSLRMHVPD